MPRRPLRHFAPPAAALRPGAAALLAAALLAGCGGGGDKATKQDVIAKGNALCTQTTKSLRALKTPTVSSLSQASAYLDKVAGIVEREAADARSLPRPKEDRDLLERWIAALDKDARGYRALAKAAHANDQAAFTKAAAALRSSQSQQLAKQYGLAACARAPRRSA